MIPRGRASKIRAPRRGLNKDEVDFEGTWKILSTAFREIHYKNASQLSFEELFRNAYKLVLKKRQEELYENVVELERAWLQDEVRSRIVSLISPAMLVGMTGDASDTQANERRIAGERFLKALKDAFADQQMCIGMITDVLMYMERIVSHEGRKPSIYTATMSLFRTEMLKAPCNEGMQVSILDLLENVLLDMIKMERKGEVVDRTLIRACCYMLEGLYERFNEDETTKLYLTSFEPKFLDASRKFYHDEGQGLVADADASTFCSHARRRLREEEERCQQTISPITDPKIREVVEKELISAHIKDIINMEGTGVRNMLDNDRIEDLANVYELISRVDPKKAALKEAVQKRVVDLGMEINKTASSTSTAPAAKPAAKPQADKGQPDRVLNQQTQAAITWVEQILNLKAKYDRLWYWSFQKDTVMEKALEISFQDFINSNDRSSEHLSLFLDEYLKRGGKGKSEAEVDSLLDKGILLLQYLANTDLFETYYRKHMAKRLLMKKSVSRDMERQMLSKMKMKLGNNITQKLEGMIRDMELSDNLGSQFKKDYVKGDGDRSRAELDARILTTNVWPFESWFRNDDSSESRSTIKYPAILERTKQTYERFYLNKHTGRKLTWMPNLGDADVSLRFKGSDGKMKRYELNVSTHTMIVLLLFNDLSPDQGITFEEIAAETNIASNELVKTLSSLSQVPRWRVLKKVPASKEILPDDIFFFNENFTSNFVKIKIAAVISGSNKVENADERKETQKRIDDERGHAIEAAIVRIMKQRKSLSHQQLMSETLQQLSSRFQPDVNMVKRKIEALIDREYLERGSDPAKPSYNYLA